jgi:hypothetical protein
VARVLYVKRVHGREFLVLDAGLNDLLRPALYGAYHRVVPLARREREVRIFDVAGAVCESSDIFARDRELAAPERGEHLAILDAGAYGFAAWLGTTTSPRAGKVVVEDGRPASSARPRPGSARGARLGRLVSATTRKLVLVILLVLLVFALALYVTRAGRAELRRVSGSVSWSLLGPPVKGSSIHRLEAAKPYRGRLAARRLGARRASRPPRLSFWPLMG